MGAAHPTRGQLGVSMTDAGWAERRPKGKVAKWGVYDRRHCDDKTVHVSPCDEDGVICGHTVLIRCPCNPKREQYGDFTLIVHQEH